MKDPKRGLSHYQKLRERRKLRYQNAKKVLFDLGREVDLTLFNPVLRDRMAKDQDLEVWVNSDGLPIVKAKKV